MMDVMHWSGVNNNPKCKQNAQKHKTKRESLPKLWLPQQKKATYIYPIGGTKKQKLLPEIFTNPRGGAHVLLKLIYFLVWARG